MVKDVVKSSGRYVFRVWFGDTPDPTVQDETLRELVGMGTLVERSSRNLIAVDAATQEMAQRVADFLWKEQQAGRFLYENGRQS